LTDRWDGHGSLLDLVRHRLDERAGLRCHVPLNAAEQAEYDGLLEIEERLLQRS